MAGRPKKKNGRVVNFYISDEVLELIEEYRGTLSRSQFVEEAILSYVSKNTEKHVSSPTPAQRRGGDSNSRSQ